MLQFVVCLFFFLLLLLSFVSSTRYDGTKYKLVVDRAGRHSFHQEQPLFFMEFSEPFRVREAPLRVDRRGSEADVLLFL